MREFESMFRYTFFQCITGLIVLMGSMRPTVAKANVSDGIVFECSPAQITSIKKDMATYLTYLDIEDDWLVVKESGNKLQYTLSTPQEETNTLNLHRKHKYRIRNDKVQLPQKNQTYRQISTVSKREILLSLMQHGRTTQFSGENCAVPYLEDHVGIRQNIVAWAQTLEWGWPDGGPARWNKRFWHKGTPLSSVTADAAIQNAFLEQSKYAIGCYTASKLVIVQGVLDYYIRIKKDPSLLQTVSRRLLLDGEPLVDVEPTVMWYFESDYQSETAWKTGKLLFLQEDVARDNFVPGDWAYFLNTDKKTYEKTGYEGSNAIYLGGNRFDDYYNDNGHSYTFEQKVDEVYQWRNGVFSRKRDAAKIKKLSSREFMHLSTTPEKGGLLLAYRAVPILFNAKVVEQLEK